MKSFQVEGNCVPEYHYMIDVKGRVNQIIRELIEPKKYFVINRARQYGKTTILNALYRALRNRYIVFFISFEELGNSSYSTEAKFCSSFIRLLVDEIEFEGMEGIPDSVMEEMKAAIADENVDFLKISGLVSRMCSGAEKPVILMIDEVDSASNNRVFIDFLGMLRNKYLQRNRRPAFQSVILAGVYDIKNLQLKIRPDEEHKYNSPWNIAADFKVDMSFSLNDIVGMLNEYEEDHHTEMDIEQMAKMLYDYTSGYPFLVSRLCKLMDEEVCKMDGFARKKAAWTKNGFHEAEKMVLSEKNTLFESFSEKLSSYPELNTMFRAILFNGKSIGYNYYEPAINIGTMFGFVKNQCGTLAVANRIFDTWLYNLYLSSSEMQDIDIYEASLVDKN